MANLGAGEIGTLPPRLFALVGIIVRLTCASDVCHLLRDLTFLRTLQQHILRKQSYVHITRSNVFPQPRSWLWNFFYGG
jgi:hypothetical protein